MTSLTYKPDGDVIKQFMKDTSFFRGLRGPVGSGKSVSCCVEILRRALEQKPSEDGIKRSRWAVIRNTNPQLKTTTIKTWLDWFPEETWGKFTWSVPYTHKIKKGDLELEVIFLALDRPEDVKKLLSLELTGVWINEAREIPKSIVDACTMRVGRYPSMRDGGPTWYGVICDTNPPDTDHWWSILAGETVIPDYITKQEAKMLVKPDNWRFFNQPPAMLEQYDDRGELNTYNDNTNKENGKNLTKNYYENIIRGKTKSWIDVYVLNKLGQVEDGKPVYEMFNRDVHVAKSDIAIVPQAPVYVGIDFGLTPACVFGQKLRGRWLIIDELVAEDMGILRFSDLMKQKMAEYLPRDFTIFGDPAGDHRAQTDESTPFQILKGRGIMARPTHSNDVSLRLESVNATLQRMIDGESGLLIDPKCVNIIKGFDGGYHYRRMQVSGERYDEKPNKNRFSHIHDALQYMLLGAGEGRSLTVGQSNSRPVVAKRNFNVFDLKSKSIYERRK
ncbi:large subunit terminase [uncultured Mediterranean phage uvMED]|nr:large subunit terminase [uncultured Mediterranean phage uvMED]|tara:strand:+ start:5148 stop:6653 length:1506 start_codon:yes stop_codon:yes gene_type:complete